MLIGIPKEIKNNEFRVGMTPPAVAEAVHHGHRAIVEIGAGVGSGSPDEEYARAGAELADTAAEIFARADMIVKVKEPQAGRDRDACARGRSFSPICISRPISRRRRGFVGIRRRRHRL